MTSKSPSGPPFDRAPAHRVPLKRQNPINVSVKWLLICRDEAPDYYLRFSRSRRNWHISPEPLVTPGIIHISLRSGTINSQPLMMILTPQDKWPHVFDNENIPSARVPSETHVAFAVHFMADGSDGAETPTGLCGARAAGRAVVRPFQSP